MSVVMLNVVMLNVVMLNVVMLNVVAPNIFPRYLIHFHIHCKTFIFVVINKVLFFKESCTPKGNCNNFYFTFEFEVQMWVQIYWIFERDQISICQLTNKLNLNTYKPEDFWIRLNINKYHQFGEKLRSNYSKILVSYCNFSVNIAFYHFYLQIHCLNLVQYVQYLP